MTILSIASQYNRSLQITANSTTLDPQTIIFLITHSGHLLEKSGLFSCQSFLFGFLDKKHVGTDVELGMLNWHVELGPSAPFGGL